MFPTLRNNYGNAAFIFPLLAILAIPFEVPIIDVAYSSALMYITAIIMLMLEDIVRIPYEFPTVSLLSEEELQKIDDDVTEHIIRGYFRLPKMQHH